MFYSVQILTLSDKVRMYNLGLIFQSRFLASRNKN